MRPENLPDQAAAKLAALEGAARDALDAEGSARQRLNALGGRRDDVARREMGQLQESAGRHHERHTTLASLASRLNQWLDRLPPGTALEMACPPEPPLHPGETLVKAVARIRDEITAARNHHRAVSTAPLPKADAKALAASHVAVLAGRGKPRVEVGDTLKVVFTDPLADFGVSADFVSATLSWLAPDRVLAALEREIDALEEPRAPMPAAERKKREAELAADLDRLEREDEALIALAAAQGTEILRRPDAAPAAVLGVAVAQAKAQAAA